MQDLNDLHLFVRVVDQNGFASAARKLGMPRSRLIFRSDAPEFIETILVPRRA